MLGLTAVLLAGLGLVSLVGPLVEGTRRGPEQVTRAYLEDLQRSDLESALSRVEPSQRDSLRGWVQIQNGNSYDVRIAVTGRPSIAARAESGEWADRLAWVDVEALVRPRVGAPWRSTSRAEVVRANGQWLLTRPPFT